jgi:hypothetical protein
MTEFVFTTYAEQMAFYPSPRCKPSPRGRCC